LAATTEAVEVYRRLAKVDQAAHELDLAKALGNRGMMLLDLGRWEDALAATTEAVEVFSRLTQVNPAAHEPDRAIGLSNLGMILSRLGRHVEALTATEDAVEVFRRVAAANPTAHEPALGMALNNLGQRLSESERWEEALTATAEVVKVFSRLTQVDPAAHEPGLAKALSNLGTLLERPGLLTLLELPELRDEALTATAEAVKAYRQLAAENPTAYALDLALSLWTFSLVRAAGQRELLHEALAAAVEASAQGTLTDVLRSLGHREAARVRRLQDPAAG
jgi:tetratricopeptide (TPR) repeat protein